MREHDMPQFQQLMADVLAYYRQDASTFVLGLWWNTCRGFELEQVRAALQRHCTDPERGQFAPKVADLARILQGTATDRASLAWGKVLEAMSSVGAYTDVVFDDPAIHAAADDMGGWPKMCRTEIKELGLLQHRFMQSYRAYTERGQFDYPRRLGGDRSPDSEYEKAGLKLPRPALIGDPCRAKLVYQGGGAGKTTISFQSIQSLGGPIAAAIEGPRSAA